MTNSRSLSSVLFSVQRFIPRSTVAVLSIALTACSGGGGTAPIDTPQPAREAGMLSQATSEAALARSLKRGLGSAFDADNAPQGADLRLASLESAATQSDSSASDSASGFSNTYTIEQGVGEADLVKYDGELLYAVQRAHYFCPECDNQSTGVNVFRTDAANASSAKLGQIELNNDLTVEGLYLPEPGRLVVLQSSAFYGVCGVGWGLPWYWQDQKTRLSFFDTSDPANPVTTSVLELDGAFTASRRVDGNLYLVSRYTPNLPGVPEYFSTEGSELEAAQSQVDAIALNDLLPKLNHNGLESNMLSATDCYVPTDAEFTPESASLTTVSVIPMNNPEGIQSTCYTGEAYGMYMSTENLYLTSQRYEYTADSSADFSLIHKFSLNGQSVEYSGSAEIPGTLGHGEQLDFRISEHNGLLRVVTSEYDYSRPPINVFDTELVDEVADSIDHRVTILRDSTSEVALEVVSTLPNESRPAEIGKPDERLYGVRFFGNRAYMVTFEQIDPLYVIDLANPEDPRIAGELEVPGVSDFLHPVNDELLLTVGRFVTDVEFGDTRFTVLRGVKLELFNTADITQPFSMGSIELGGRFSFSEAVYSRQAFNYHANFDGDNNDRFALPADVYIANDSAQQLEWTESGLFTFELRNTNNPGNASIVEAGRLINQQASGDNNYPINSGARRSRFNNDAVYLIDNGHVVSGGWNEQTTTFTD